jgi:hypothetical protein
MVSNKTYNNVVNTLCRIGEYHQQIASVSVGDIYDINLENQKFPLLHINPTSVTLLKTNLVLSRFKKGLTIYYAAGLLQ